MSVRIHITSSGPRTGSTLLMEVMKSCFEIDCSCEHEASLAQSNSSFGKCNIVLTKQPSETHRIYRILNAVNKLHIICIIRDPRDMIVSYHGRVKDKYYCGLNYWFSFLENYNKVAKHPRFILIKYEDFTTNPDRVQDFLISEIPYLRMKSRFSEYHKIANPDFDSLLALKSIRPIESKGIGVWRNHLPRIKQQIEEHGQISESLMQFKYEIDSNWLVLLEDVKSTRHESYKSEETYPYTSYKTYILIRFNFFCERLGVNPFRILRFYKKFWK